MDRHVESTDESGMDANVRGSELINPLISSTYSKERTIMPITSIYFSASTDGDKAAENPRETEIGRGDAIKDLSPLLQLSLVRLLKG